jgi:hypothetical protein
MTKYVIEARIEVEIDNDDLDGPNEAWKIVDNTLQRAWDTDQGRHHVAPWHFEMLDDAVVEIVEEEGELGASSTTSA